MSIGDTRLVLRLHVSGHVRLYPHQPALIVLDTHDSLGSVSAGLVICFENVLVREVSDLDVDRGLGFPLEAEVTVPGHVLDCQQGAIGDDDHVKITVADEHAVRGLNNLRQNVLDRVCRRVALLLGPRVAANKDWLA